MKQMTFNLNGDSLSSSIAGVTYVYKKFNLKFVILDTTFVST